MLSLSNASFPIIFSLTILGVLVVLAIIGVVMDFMSGLLPNKSSYIPENHKPKNKP